MTYGTEPEIPVLAHEVALKLWRKGPAVWNEWINQHPGWNISFLGIDFSSERDSGGILSFSGYHFGDSNVDFVEATFGDGPVSFTDANFGDGTVDFSHANFGDGIVNFVGATFGDGGVLFERTEFGDGDVIFREASFGDGVVNFFHSNFGDGDVDFTDASFGNGDVDFSEANFGDGDVNFSHTNFGDGDVNFSQANFGDGDVHFFYADFTDGNVDFSEANFGHGNVNFSNTKFGDGDVSFSHAHFGDGDVNFIYADFTDGDVDFSNAKFGDGDVDFSNAKFGDGDMSFSHAHFGDGDVNFIYADFTDGNVDFSEANFGNGNLNFFEAIFGVGSLDFSEASQSDGTVDFTESTFGDSTVIFDQAKLAALYFSPATIGTCRIESRDLLIRTRAIFALPAYSETWAFLDFHGATFDGSLTLSGNFDVIPDLRATRYSHQVDLSMLNVKLQRTWGQWSSWPPKLSPVVEDATDGAKLRRLKEIAETHKDHHAALRFSADENRARRWHETSWLGSVLDMAFSACSDYGQNILRPSGALLAFTVAFTVLYQAMSTGVSRDIRSIWEEALLLSVSNSMPFLPQSRILRTDAIDVLYSSNPTLAVDVIMVTQGIVSFAFLFLIGLGLRNRFRL